MSAGRHAATFAVWTAVGLLAGLGALVTVPRLAGVTPFTILSGSMTPTLAVGDVVLDERVAPMSVRPGDIVTFNDPSRGGKTVTHRVRRMWRDGGHVHFTTRGDANTAVENWDVAASGTIGRVRMHVPKLGIVLTWAHTREGRLGLIAFPALLLGLIELGGLLRPRPRVEASPA
jgi:signal peptidase